MRVLQKIQFNHCGNEKIIYFGEPTDHEELEKMFKLRFQVYSKHGYIVKENYPDFIEKDVYDTGKCRYLIAKIDGDVIGSVRLIRDYYLPTEKECFKFEEPQAMRKIPRDQRVELSRLVAMPYKIDNHFIPRHLVLLGLISSALKIAKEENIKGGYAFIKKSLSIKLNKIGIPYHLIKPYTQIYSCGPLYNYFHQAEDPVFPIYFLKDEIEDYLNKIFNNKLIFERIDENSYSFKKTSKIRLFLNYFLFIFITK